jgi:membrane-associated protein
MDISQIVDIFLHLDKHLNDLVLSYGPLTYGILAAVVFCETGLVITPFLPGDSLLFVAGAIASKGSLDLWLLMGILFVCAVVGDAVNYTIGKMIGPRVFEGNSRIFKRQYLEKTQKFYEKYGGKTIIIARFVPIVRTFAPFLAGVGTMSYPRFAAYNVIGAFLWVGLFCTAGYLFGEIPVVKKNFTLVIFAIIGLSILPAVIEGIKARREAQRSSTAQPNPSL